MDEETEPGAASAAEPPAVGEPAVVLDPPDRHPGRTRGVLFGLGRSVVALAAVAVLGVTGYNWQTLRNLDQGIVRTNVFDTTTPAAPTGSSQAPVPPLTSDVNILVVGMDSRTDPHGNPLPDAELAGLHAGPNDGELNTDTMILVHIPAGGQQAVAISFPRDSWVQLAGGFGHNRLNSAFAFAHNQAAGRLRAQGMTDPAQIEMQANTEGAKNLIATIEQLIGNTITINRYAEINLAGFYQLSQAVGGVQVCLKAATHDDFTGASFPAGVQTISGVHALDFVRQRHGLPGGDLDRIVRQQVFLGALASKILSAGTLTSPSRIAALTTAVQNSLTLSSGWDIASFALQMQGLTGGAIQFNTIPTGAPEVIGGADVLATSQPQIEQYVNGLLNGTNLDGGTPTVTTDTPTTAPVTPAKAGGGTGSNASTTTANAGTTTTPITASGTRCVN
jgi:LCP family protein required for cell wall assembly